MDAYGEITVKDIAIGTGIAVLGVAAGVVIGVVTAPAVLFYATAIATGAALAFEIDAGYPTFKCAAYWADRCLYRNGYGDRAGCAEMWNGLAGVMTGWVIGRTIAKVIGSAVRAAWPYIDDMVRAGKPYLDDLVKLLKRPPRVAPPPPARIPQKALNVLKHVDQTGGAPAGYKGGKTWSNDGRDGGQILPRFDWSGKPITYREFDVNPYVKGVNRGKERIVTGSDGRAYYTDTHYDEFQTIR